MNTVRREARALVRQLTLPSPWSMPDLCLQVEQLRGRRVVVQAVSTGDATATVRREAKRDVITYRDDHHNPDHLVAHELGHLLAGHLDGGNGLAAGVSPDLGEAVRAMNRACAYDSHEERLAEAVADLLLAGARQHTTRYRGNPAAATKLRGFGEAMR